MPPQEGVQCIFCQIAQGAVPARKVFDGDGVLAVLDINPANPGHVLIIPKEHVTVLPQAPDEVAERAGELARTLGTAAMALFRQMKCQGTTVLVANGPGAGQRAGHAVVHFIPRFPQDGIGLTVHGGSPPNDQRDFQEMLARAAAQAFGYPENEFLKNAKPTMPLHGQQKPEPPKAGNDLDDLAAFLAGRK